MRLSSLFKYFIYLSSNWNLRIAFHIIRHEIRGEKKYNINTTGADELEDLQNMGIDISHATIYMPGSYDLLETLFNKLDTTSITHLIDIGSGKGRIMAVAAHYGIWKISGIDLSRKFCDDAIANLSKINERFPDAKFDVINNDAFYYEIPDDVNCIFLFNPFDELIMSAVLNNIMESLLLVPRDLDIVYMNPMHKELFLACGFKETFHTSRLHYLEASILRYHTELL